MLGRRSSPLPISTAVSGGEGNPDDAGLLGRSGRSGRAAGLPRKMAEDGRWERALLTTGRGVAIHAMVKRK